MKRVGRWDASSMQSSLVLFLVVQIAFLVVQIEGHRMLGPTHSTNFTTHRINSSVHRPPTSGDVIPGTVHPATTSSNGTGATNSHTQMPVTPIPGTNHPPSPPFTPPAPVPPGGITPSPIVGNPATGGGVVAPSIGGVPGPGNSTIPPPGPTNDTILAPVPPAPTVPGVPAGVSAITPVPGDPGAIGAVPPPPASGLPSELPSNTTVPPASQIPPFNVTLTDNSTIVLPIAPPAELIGSNTSQPIPDVGSTPQTSNETNLNDPNQVQTDPDDKERTADGFTLAPIKSDDIIEIVPPAAKAQDHTSNASTSSSHSEPIGGWKLALIITGSVCAVLVSILFVHLRHVRIAAANKRPRGSFEQRALESFFRQNRVTVPAVSHTSSGDNFVTEPLTPCDEITIVTTSFEEAASTKTSDVVASSRVPVLLNPPTRAGRTNCTTPSINTPTDSYGDNRYDSFTGVAPSSVLSSHSSNKYGSGSVHSLAHSSVSRGSIARASLPHSLQPSLTRSSKLNPSQNDGANAFSSSSDYSVLDASARSDFQNTSVLTLTNSSKSKSSGGKSLLSRDSDVLSDFSTDEGYTNSFVDIEQHFVRDTEGSFYQRKSEAGKISDV